MIDFTNIQKESIKQVIVIYTVAIVCSPFFIFMHEWGHLVVGTAFGWTVVDFVVNYDNGYVVFLCVPELYDAVISHTLISFAGAGATILITWLISKLYQPFRVYIALLIPYGIWETGQGFLRATGASPEILRMYQDILNPIYYLGIFFLMTLVWNQTIIPMLKEYWNIK